MFNRSERAIRLACSEFAKQFRGSKFHRNCRDAVPIVAESGFAITPNHLVRCRWEDSLDLAKLAVATQLWELLPLFLVYTPFGPALS